MFKNCSIVAVSANPTEYQSIQPGCERGQPSFVMSSSALRSFWTCPSKWVTPITDADGNVTYWEFAGSKSTEWGNLFDCLLLTPEQFKDRYAVQPKTYATTVLQCPNCQSVTEAKTCRRCKVDRVPTTLEQPWSLHSEECKQWKADREAEGKIITNERELFKVNQALARFRRDENFSTFLDNSETQVWVKGEWHDPSGIVVPCKCLIDIVPTLASIRHKSIADVKTTKNARPMSWEKWAHAAGYDIQAAWNIDMFVAASNREILQFCFLLSENEAPYEIGRRMMDQDILEPSMDQGDIAAGRRQYVRMLADYCACLKKQKWFGYDDTDESSKGWTLVRPNPYAEQARQYSPHFAFEEEDEKPEIETDPDVIP